MTVTSEAQAARPVPASLVVAAALGTLHAAVSLYWAAGGTALLWSLGTGMIQRFAGREWLLVPIGLTKLAVALTPLLLARSGWPAPRVTRAVCWLGAAGLVVWGGLNTVVGQLVLSGVIDPEGATTAPGCSVTPGCGTRCSCSGEVLSSLGSSCHGWRAVGPSKE